MPPSEGPSAAATAPVALQSATAVALICGGNSGNTSDSEVGTSTAPAAACSTRAPMSQFSLGAIPHRNDAVPRTP